MKLPIIDESTAWCTALLPYSHRLPPSVPQGKIHMLQNSGNELMKVAGFFAPPTDFSNYKMFEDIQFPA